MTAHHGCRDHFLPAKRRLGPWRARGPGVAAGGCPRPKCGGSCKSTKGGRKPNETPQSPRVGRTSPPRPIPPQSPCDRFPVPERQPLRGRWFPAERSSQFPRARCASRTPVGSPRPPAQDNSGATAALSTSEHPFLKTLGPGDRRIAAQPPPSPRPISSPESPGLRRPPRAGSLPPAKKCGVVPPAVSSPTSRAGQCVGPAGCKCYERPAAAMAALGRRGGATEVATRELPQLCLDAAWTYPQ